MNDERELKEFKEFTDRCCNHRVITPEIEKMLRDIQTKERVLKHGRAA